MSVMWAHRSSREASSCSGSFLPLPPSCEPYGRVIAASGVRAHSRGIFADPDPCHSRMESRNGRDAVKVWANRVPWLSPSTLPYFRPPCGEDKDSHILTHPDMPVCASPCAGVPIVAPLAVANVRIK